MALGCVMYPEALPQRLLLLLLPIEAIADNSHTVVVVHGPGWFNCIPCTVAGSCDYAAAVMYHKSPGSIRAATS